MLISVAISLVILIPFIILHYSQHFLLNVSCQKEKSLSSIGAASVRELRTSSHSYNSTRNKCGSNCLFIPIDEDFNFFPVLFLYYMFFVLSICLVMIILEVINCIYTENEINFYNFSVKSYPHHSIFELQQIQTAPMHPIAIYICDFIIIYGILILYIWTSFFSFYRYYTTFMTTKQFTAISTSSVVLRFAIFAVIFLFLFIIEIHLYFWLWPVIIAAYCGFNCYCSWKFASILIKQYEFFTSVQNDYVYTTNQDVLESVYFMKKTSLICCVLQTFSLSIFVIMYNVDSVYYLPIFWSLSCAGFALNFIRNRTFLKSVFHFESKKLSVANHSNKPVIKQYVLTKQIPHDIRSNDPQVTDNKTHIEEDAVEINNKRVSIHDDVDLSAEANASEIATTRLNDLHINVDIKDIEIESTERRRLSSRYKTPTESLSGYDWDTNRRSSRHKLKYGRSNSMPVNIDETVDEEQIDIDQVLRSFNILAKYGFCTVGDMDAYNNP